MRIFVLRNYLESTLEHWSKSFHFCIILKHDDEILEIYEQNQNENCMITLRLFQT